MIWATPERRTRLTFELFLISFLALYAELVVIRWLASEVRVFAYFKNLPFWGRRSAKCSTPFRP